MPRRTDIKSVLVIGSGPIVIGQACEFDYSGTQACRVLREEGLRVSLVNSNPATIMTDPEFADATYIEPITPEFVEKVIAAERPDALLPTLGGQTALNIAIALHERGVLEKYGVELIGADIEAIHAGEDRQPFKGIVRHDRRRRRPQRRVPHRGRRRSTSPRSSATRSSSGRRFTLGGAGSGFAHDEAELRRMVGAGPGRQPGAPRCWSRRASSAGRSTSSRSCATARTTSSSSARSRTSTRWASTPATSITVAPAMTLTDREYQHMRDIGDRGHPRGRRRHRRLQHPVRGRPGDRPARRHRDEPAGVAVERAGLQGDRLPDRQDRGEAGDRLHPRRDPQRHHRARRRPASSRRLDYVVVKVPRFAFEKFPGADPTLTTHMKIGRRGDGDRPQLHRGAAEGAALAGGQGRRASGPFAGARPGDKTPTLLEQAARPHDGRLHGRR